jgi:hypothetical protein
MFLTPHSSAKASASEPQVRPEKYFGMRMSIAQQILELQVKQKPKK